MGFWMSLLKGKSQPPFPFGTYDPAQQVLPDPHEPFMGAQHISSGITVADPGIPLMDWRAKQVSELWRTQPNVAKVIDFIARNVASIPLHVYERVGDNDRRRVTTGPLADLVAQPAPRQPPFRFWRDVIADSLLYDRWGALKVTDEATDGRMTLVQIPSWRLYLKLDALRRVRAAYYWTGDGLPPVHTRVLEEEPGWEPIALDTLIYDHGYSPGGGGMSPVDRLRALLQENEEAVKWRQQVWENGARTPTYIHRPTLAPQWSDEARTKFARQFRDAYTGEGAEAGGTPLLEDGMELRAISAFPSKDALDLEGRKLNAIEVASAFHIAPELVGAREGTYSNVDAFRQMLYRDSLGPYITAWEQALNAQLTPDLAEGRPLYIEAHVEAKLRGSFEEQAKVMQSATGAPYLTRNEARAMQNRPPIEGGDELVTPLNVLEGGQASPQDSGSQNLNAIPAATITYTRQQQPERITVTQLPAGEDYIKAVAEEKAATRPADVDPIRDRFAKVLADFFTRQEAVVRSALGSKARSKASSKAAWWDEERWNTELTDDLAALATTIAAEIGTNTAQQLGYQPGDYDPEATRAFLRAVAERRATSINAATRIQIEDALQVAVTGTPEEAAAAMDGVWNVATEQRSLAAGAAIGAAVVGFATTEAARQTVGTSATKTWITGANPRRTHAAMNGETVGLEEKFSNGAAWPGDDVLSVDELAGCNCSIAIDYGTE